MTALRPAGLVTLMSLALAFSGASAAETRPFHLRVAEVRQLDGVYMLDAIAQLQLTPTVRRALHSGVDLQLIWRIEILRERYWWLDAEVAEVNQRYRIEYHELSLQYLVTNLNTGERRSFVDLRGALDHIGRLVGFPLIDRVLIDAEASHSGRAQISLDHGALPWPLRPTALFSSAWNLQSEWRAWSFE